MTVSTVGSGCNNAAVLQELMGQHKLKSVQGHHIAIAVVPKKPVVLYKSTTSCLDLYKYFSDEFMGSVIRFGSY